MQGLKSAQWMKNGALAAAAKALSTEYVSTESMESTGMVVASPLRGWGQPANALKMRTGGVHQNNQDN